MVRTDVEFGAVSAGECKTYRQGQNNTVVVHHIVTKGTVDEDVMTALNDKDMGQASLMEAIKARMEGIYK